MRKEIGRVFIRAGLLAVCLATPAAADEYRDVSRAHRHRKIVVQHVVREHVFGPRYIMPACVEVAWWGFPLMKCIPRPIVAPPYPLPDEIAWKTLPRIRGPYGELFSLPYGP
jgi:hypothetical protein